MAGIDDEGRLLAANGARAWFDQARNMARRLHAARSGGNEFLLVGTPAYEPWHLAAHLSDVAMYTHRPGLAPTLVRHQVPVDAPPHLRVGLDRLGTAGRNDAVLVSTPQRPDDHLLERLSDARRAGVMLLSLDCGDAQLRDLVHDALVCGADNDDAGHDGLVGFNLGQHLLSLAIWRPGRAGRSLRAWLRPHSRGAA
jgi:hypothetical protein